MHTVMLIVCMAGTPPTPSNPTCGLFLFPKEQFQTRAACWTRAGEMVKKADEVLKPQGFEAWRHPQLSCMPDDERPKPKQEKTEWSA